MSEKIYNKLTIILIIALIVFAICPLGTLLVPKIGIGYTIFKFVFLSDAFTLLAFLFVAFINKFKIYFQ